MEREPLARVVLEVVRAQAPVSTAVVDEDSPLGPGGLGIDSIGCLELVLELERRTGIALRDESLTAETFATPRNLIDHLARATRG
ncbi:MAG: acyl carrier protein [Planctomycetes bacterium]|nr:acyl carrier protein [Planctomycetota bacterium]